jgi:hypothetical protein
VKGRDWIDIVMEGRWSTNKKIKAVVNFYFFSFYFRFTQSISLPQGGLLSSPCA